VKTKVPAIEGWFVDDADGPALVGLRCAACRTVHFPPSAFRCRNPDCGSRQLSPDRLSSTGRIWSFTDARYQPPPPYVAVTDPYEPFALAAVELDADGLVVLGQLTNGVGVDDVAVGQPVELVVETLFSDDEHEYTMWRWQPVGGRS
jgi:uncharacterized OB-fold protein